MYARSMRFDSFVTEDSLHWGRPSGCYWPISVVRRRAAHVCSAQVFRTSHLFGYGEGIVDPNAAIAPCFDLGVV